MRGSFYHAHLYKNPFRRNTIFCAILSILCIIHVIPCNILFIPCIMHAISFIILSIPCKTLKMVHLSGILAALVASTSLVQAHPGESQAQKRAEMDLRNKYIRSMEKSDLVHCAGKLTALGEVQKTVERRETILKTLRRKRGLSEQGKLATTPPHTFKSEKTSQLIWWDP